MVTAICGPVDVSMKSEIALAKFVEMRFDACCARWFLRRIVVTEIMVVREMKSTIPVEA
jgi:hypothetical protein